MPKLNKKQLKDQFTLRIYNQEDKDILEKSFERNKSGFDSISDFIRYCTITGAEKLLGDNEVDNRLNLNEIKEILKDMKDKLFHIKSEIEVNHNEQKIDNELIEKLLNYISNVVYYSDCNKEILDKLQDGLFSLPLERLKVMEELNG
ncbi:MAG: hypothetical protein PHX62_00120 [Bacilli bacterium]|nr:hypothetical protein [Bacilli bacterium]